MKTLSNSYIILFVIVTVSVLDVRCQNSTITPKIEDNTKPPEVCKNSNEDCYQDNECCSKNCERLDTSNRGYCGVDKTLPVCKNLNDDCYQDSECCSNNCQRSIKMYRGYCDLNQTILASIGDITLMPRIFPDHCLYYKQNDSEIKENLFKRFDVNAAHSGFAPRTKILVLSSLNRQVVVTISDFPPRTTDALELSEEAALELGMIEEGTIPCKLDKLIVLPPSPLNYARTVLFFVPVFAFTVGLWFYHV